MFLEIVENGLSNTDKLLICLAIILLLTIIWTILIGIMCGMSTRNKEEKKTKLLFDEFDDDDEVVVKKTKKTSKKKAKSKTKKSNTKSARKTTAVVKSSSKQEVYVKVKFYGSKKNLIYVAPENVILRKGEKIKVRTDEGIIRTATVTQGNYLREKYKTYEYQTLELA